MKRDEASNKRDDLCLLLAMMMPLSFFVVDVEERQEVESDLASRGLGEEKCCDKKARESQEEKSVEREQQLVQRP